MTLSTLFITGILFAFMSSLFHLIIDCFETMNSFAASDLFVSCINLFFPCLFFAILNKILFFLLDSILALSFTTLLRCVFTNKINCVHFLSYQYIVETKYHKLEKQNTTNNGNKIPQIMETHLI